MKTIKYLQDALIEVLKKEFTGYKLVNQQENLVNFNIYPNSLPEKKRENDENHFPFFITKVINGKIESMNDDETVIILILIGIFDDNDNNQGNKEIINIIEKCKNFLMNSRFIQGYELIYPLEWAIQEEDTKPYYYGGIETRWKIKKIKEKEDEYI